MAVDIVGNDILVRMPTIQFIKGLLSEKAFGTLEWKD